MRYICNIGNITHKDQLMSMPSYSIRCHLCDYESSSRATWGARYYKDEEGVFECHHQMGWCDGCQSVTAIEDFGEVLQAATHIRSALDAMKRDTEPTFVNLLTAIFTSRRKWQTAAVKAINTHIKYIQLAQTRSGQERCLKCGNRGVVAYKPVKQRGDHIEAKGFMYHGHCTTDFVHPGCGGQLYEQADSVRLNINLQAKFYTLNGDFIES